MSVVMTAENPDRWRLYFARQGQNLLAASIVLTVGGHVWSAYGGLAHRGRELCASNLIKWVSLGEAHVAGAQIYDLRGISDTLNESDPSFGTTRFKLGIGGEVVEDMGEWDFAFDESLHKEFLFYLKGN